MFDGDKEKVGDMRVMFWFGFWCVMIGAIAQYVAVIGGGLGK